MANNILKGRPHGRCALLAFCVVGTLRFAAVRADIYCSGPISEVLMEADGTVLINGTWRNDWTELCNSQGSWNNIDGATCLAWYGAAVKAVSDQTPAGVYYIGSSYTCQDLPTYASSPAPFYFRYSH